MAIKGIFVSDAGALSERNTGLSSVILREQRGYGVPFFALSSGMGSEDATGPLISWYEDNMSSSRTIIQAAPDPVGNMLIVEDASWLTENMTLMIEQTGEHILVLAITGNTLTVQRGIAQTPVLPIALGGGTEVGLQLLGTAFEEGSERPTSLASNPYPRTNQTQIFRNSWDITRTAQVTQYRFGDRQARNKAEAAMYHAEQIERTLIFGKSHFGHVNNRPFRMMDGMMAQMRTNFFAAPAGGLTRRSLEDYIERLFSKNIQGMANERITFCGNVAVRALNEIVRRYTEYEIVPMANEYGLRVLKYVTPFGDLTLMIHPMFNENPVWQSYMWSFHPGAPKMVWLSRTFHQDGDENGRASNLRDATAGVFTSELTIKYPVEQTAALMDGITVDHYVL